MEKRDKPNGCKIRVRAPYLATSERSWPQGTLAQCLERWGMECSSWFSSRNVIATLTSIKCLPKMSKQNVKFQTSPLWYSFLGRCALCSLLSLITFRSSSGFSHGRSLWHIFDCRLFFPEILLKLRKWKSNYFKKYGCSIEIWYFCPPISSPTKRFLISISLRAKRTVSIPSDPFERAVQIFSQNPTSFHACFCCKCIHSTAGPWLPKQKCKHTPFR